MFRKTVIVLMLLLTPLAQARMAFECSMRDGQVMERCCCGHHAPIKREEPDCEHAKGAEREPALDRHGACCQTVVQLHPQTFSVAKAALAAEPEAAPDYVPIPLDVACTCASPASTVYTARFHVTADPQVHSPPLYLLTARLRL